MQISTVAQAINDSIAVLLQELLGKRLRSCGTEEFSDLWNTVLARYHDFQTQVLHDNKISAVCARGCAMCCSHWPDGVYSFEVERIASHLKREHASRISYFVSTLSLDIQDLSSLLSHADEQLRRLGEDGEGIDPVDLAVASFYQLGRPCPLLGSVGECLVYPLRPLACRHFLNFSDPRACLPEMVDAEDPHTYLLLLDERAGELMEKLHEAYTRFGDDRGFRSLLLKYLQE